MSQIDDQPHHEMMIARIDHLGDGAIDPGNCPVDDRRAGGGRWRPADTVERLLDTATSERPAQIAVVVAEDVDAKRTGSTNLVPAVGRDHRQEPNQRRIERHRGERSNRESDRLAVAHPGDDGDTGGEVAEHLAVVQWVDRHECRL